MLQRSNQNKQAAKDEEGDEDTPPRGGRTRASGRRRRCPPHTGRPCCRGLEQLRQLFVSEGVVRQAGEGNGVANGLHEADLGVPDDNGHEDEEDVFEDAGEGHD